MTEDYRVQITLNLPPEAQYEKGDMLNVRGQSFNELLLTLAEVIGSEQAQAVVQKFFGSPFPTAGAPAPSVTGAPSIGSTTGAPGTSNVSEPVMAAPQVEQALQAPAPAPAPQAGPPSPGVEYPAGATLGGPCPKCNVTTYWQPPGVNFQTKQPYNGYWRCPNRKNHA